MNLKKEHYLIMKKIHQFYFNKIKTGYTDPDDIQLIRELIDSKILNSSSFYFTSDGSWVYQNCFNIPFTHHGLQKVDELGLI
ncbi:MAG TPA: hypothetical protein PK859_11395 [Spirochaetota bacterium]|nr:hypothetical protein [Spirochaetota bacterium]